MITTFVRADRLRLATLFQSDEETRYYLNGVFIHSVGDGVCLAATNGHTLGVFHDSAGFTDDSCIVKLPKAACVAIKGIKEKEFLWFGILDGQNGRREARVFDTNQGFCDPTEAQEAMVDATHQGVIWSGAVDLIDGTFPEYGAVIPDRRAKLAETMSFFPKTALPFFDVAKERATSVRFYAAGERDPVIVDCGIPDFVGVLMPCRSDTLMVDAGNFVRPPEWAMARRHDLVPNVSAVETA